jgi:hypothetical protein
MTFDILDASNAIVHSEQNNITIDSSRVFDKKFSDITLAPGMYVLRLRILYNGGASEEFRYSFEVLQKTGIINQLPFLPWVIGVFILLIIGIFFIWKESYLIGTIEENIKKKFSEEFSRNSENM